MTRNILKIAFPLFAVIALITSCTADEFEYDRSYLCRFTFYSSNHPGNAIETCAAPGAMGQFCLITASQKDGARVLNMSMSNGQKVDPIYITTAEELYAPCALGASNGIYLGRSNFRDGKLEAFDRICRNCDEEFSLHKNLVWNDGGHYLSCPNCERVYDPNNGGMVIKGKQGKKLYHYPASYNMNNGRTVITVMN